MGKVLLGNVANVRQKGWTVQVMVVQALVCGLMPKRYSSVKP